jgi:hypothetical protein
MLSIYPPISVGVSNANPQSCAINSLFAWVLNNGTNNLVRIRKSTSVLTNTISTQANCTQLTYGTYLGVGYIFTSSSTATTGAITRITSDIDNPGSSQVLLSIKNNGVQVPCSAITYNNGYLWCVPAPTAGITALATPIIRLDIFNDLNKTTYNYNISANTSDAQVTVYPNIAAAYNAQKIYAYGSYVFTLTSTSSTTSIAKISTLISGNSGIITPPNIYSYTYSTVGISEIASDNANNIWLVSNSLVSGRIYRMSIENNSVISESSPTTGITNTILPNLKTIYAMQYGQGYLWATGYTVSGSFASIVRIDVTTNAVINTIPLLYSPNPSGITNINIYNEFLWMTDNLNAALLKIQIYNPCFMEGTKILCLTPQMKEKYIPIEHIRKGHLVKTSRDGYVPVDIIGRSTIANPGGTDRIKQRLYKCTHEKYPELFEDLYITGCHSILVDKLTEKQRADTIESIGKICVTDDKYRLMAYLDDRAKPYDATGTYTIWHLALKHDDYYMNYGIYANGLLVESTSKRYMRELSGMEIIE